MSKAIYMPSGKAGEYAKYACNFYVGCSNDCDYCYCKRGVLGHSMGKPQATLKKCFKDADDAFEIFAKELDKNIVELQRHSLFFTFTSDPMIEECRELTIDAISYAVKSGVPCKILTKRGDFIQKLPIWWLHKNSYAKRFIAFGFTLTGHDELERGASTNAERIECMRNLHNAGFKTFASIEPVISIEKSKQMIQQTLGFCDLYKIGLMSGKRDYTPFDVQGFMHDTNLVVRDNHAKVYWKDSVLDYIKMTREDCLKHADDFIVHADYNMFNKLTQL